MTVSNRCRWRNQSAFAGNGKREAGVASRLPIQDAAVSGPAPQLFGRPENDFLSISYAAAGAWISGPVPGGVTRCDSTKKLRSAPQYWTRDPNLWYGGPVPLCRHWARVPSVPRIRMAGSLGGYQRSGTKCGVGLTIGYLQRKRKFFKPLDRSIECRDIDVKYSSPSGRRG